MVVVKLELTRGQATPCMQKESTILSHPVKKVLRVWSNLAHRRTWAESYVYLTRHHPPSLATLAKTREPAQSNRCHDDSVRRK